MSWRPVGLSAGANIRVTSSEINRLSTPMAVIAGERLIPASGDVPGLPRSTLGMPEPAELADISAAEDLYEDQASVAALQMKSA